MLISQDMSINQVLYENCINRIWGDGAHGGADGN